jgi:hypothetical protein
MRTGLLKVGLPGAKEGLSEKDPLRLASRVRLSRLCPGLVLSGQVIGHFGIVVIVWLNAALLAAAAPMALGVTTTIVDRWLRPGHVEPGSGGRSVVAAAALSQDGFARNVDFSLPVL